MSRLAFSFSSSLIITLRIALVISIAHSNISIAGQLYKYKDANGHWAFSDKPPETEQTFETLGYSKNKKSVSNVRLYYVKNSEGFDLHVQNKLYAPIEIEILNPETKITTNKVIAAKGDERLFSLKNKAGKLNSRWIMGDPATNIDDYNYFPPFSSPKGHRITQGFNGKFSHKSDYSKYAIDIAMDVGTYITAVRAGTVVRVKDDYHMSGTTQYFLDKANVIMVLHDDGTIASYAHILMDTAIVKEGDKVAIGDKLARSGSSGFSTGPHLHFSIIRNAGLKNISIPFTFIDTKGLVFTPKRAMYIIGSTQP
ncbi:peptidoglycan DD-metalloendopeptidase family protein [Colwellia echini]|uniref:M23 family metallopeptidase n=1 Tax=Colwellia echini TaxID=1982103 RepID=A0ABY3MVD8_9GAMM|nr:peptidoglycan DD-metalloendopeptidase family protein [Colwellia echini]TYK65178.1 M23 family metallopeptidase [Colwellia echini]